LLVGIGIRKGSLESEAAAEMLGGTEDVSQGDRVMENRPQNLGGR